MLKEKSSIDDVPYCAPGPWEHVPANNHHGDYVCTRFGTTICDLYAMKGPEPIGRLLDKDNKPYYSFIEADVNGKVIAEAWTMLQELHKLIYKLDHGIPIVANDLVAGRESINRIRGE